MVDHKMVDGVSMPLTPQEQSDHDARAIAWAAGQEERDRKASIPDIQTQLAHITSALIKNGSLKSADIPSDVLEVVNNALDESAQIEVLK